MTATPATGTPRVRVIEADDFSALLDTPRGPVRVYLPDVEAAARRAPMNGSKKASPAKWAPVMTEIELHRIARRIRAGRDKPMSTTNKQLAEAYRLVGEDMAHAGISLYGWGDAGRRADELDPPAPTFELRVPTGHRTYSPKTHLVIPINEWPSRANADMARRHAHRADRNGDHVTASLWSDVADAIDAAKRGEQP